MIRPLQPGFRGHARHGPAITALGWLWCALLPPAAAFACLAGYYWTVCGSGFAWAVIALLATSVTWPASLLAWPVASWFVWQAAGRRLLRQPRATLAGTVVSLVVVGVLLRVVTAATGMTARCSLGF